MHSDKQLNKQKLLWRITKSVGSWEFDKHVLKTAINWEFCLFYTVRIE